MPYQIKIDGKAEKGKTDAEGVLKHRIPPNAHRGRLLLNPGTPEEEEHLLNLGYVDPVEQVTGVQARLRNLGYECGLIDKFADKRRRWDFPAPPRQEYEFDYGTVQLKATGRSSYMARASLAHRTEVLHPLFIRGVSDKLRIAHLTDMHTATHLDFFEKNLGRARVSPSQFNNWNTRFRDFYLEAKFCDLIFMTGDLIDFGRRHMGLNKRVDNSAHWWYDRNWIMFYAMLAGGSSTNYSAPVYTVLGNHDWRPHPYGFAGEVGAPGPGAYNLSSRDEIAKIAGPGSKYTWYTPFAETPINNDINSVVWYLLLINPFLNYTARFPGGYTFLMLDWAEQEKIILPKQKHGWDRLMIYNAANRYPLRTTPASWPTSSCRSPSSSDSSQSGACHPCTHKGRYDRSLPNNSSTLDTSPDHPL